MPWVFSAARLSSQCSVVAGVCLMPAYVHAGVRPAPPGQAALPTRVARCPVADYPFLSMVARRADLAVLFLMPGGGGELHLLHLSSQPFLAGSASAFSSVALPRLPIRLWPSVWTPTSLCLGAAPPLARWRTSAPPSMLPNRLPTSPPTALQRPAPVTGLKGCLRATPTSTAFVDIVILSS